MASFESLRSNALYTHSLTKIESIQNLHDWMNPSQLRRRAWLRALRTRGTRRSRLRPSRSGRRRARSRPRRTPRARLTSYGEGLPRLCVCVGIAAALLFSWQLPELSSALRQCSEQQGVALLPPSPLCSRWSTHPFPPPPRSLALHSLARSLAHSLARSGLLLLVSISPAVPTRAN